MKEKIGWGGAMRRLVEKLEEAYPDCDIELQMGGQPIYYYVISVE